MADPWILLRQTILMLGTFLASTLCSGNPQYHGQMAMLIQGQRYPTKWWQRSVQRLLQALKRSISAKYARKGSRDLVPCRHIRIATQERSHLSANNKVVGVDSRWFQTFGDTRRSTRAKTMAARAGPSSTWFFLLSALSIQKFSLAGSFWYPYDAKREMLQYHDYYRQAGHMGYLRLTSLTVLILITLFVFIFFSLFALAFSWIVHLHFLRCSMARRVYYSVTTGLFFQFYLFSRHSTICLGGFGVGHCFY